MSKSNNTESWRTDAMYTIREGAHLAHVSSMTVRRWQYGYQTDNRDVLPMLVQQEKKPVVSFLQLIEI